MSSVTGLIVTFRCFYLIFEFILDKLTGLNASVKGLVITGPNTLALDLEIREGAQEVS